MNSFTKRLFRGLGAPVLLTAALQAFEPVTDDTGEYLIVYERGEREVNIALDRAVALSDGGSATDAARLAVEEWNNHLGKIQFSTVGVPLGQYSLDNGIIEIAMDATVGGFEFNPNTLAVTVTHRDYFQPNYYGWADVVLNSAHNWDSYRGPLRERPDIRRVVLHQFGHVLGLAHPDEAEPAQEVEAVMNSGPIEFDSLQQDDIDGAHFLYGVPGAVPANDDFAAAAVISLNGQGQASATGTSIQSTLEPGEPYLNRAVDDGGRTIWWKWTATETTYMTASTLGSRFDTLLAVFTGDSVESLRLRGFNDDADALHGVRTSELTFSAFAGVTYYFQIDGWTGYEGPVQFNLAYASPPGPAVSVPGPRVVGVAGASHTLSVGAEPTYGGELSYQWFKDNWKIEGATESEYTIAAFTNADAGVYKVEVSEAGGGMSYGLVFVLPSYGATEVVQFGYLGAPAEPPAFIAAMSDIIQVATGDNYGLALRSDGSVVGWSLVDSLEDPPAATVPAGLSDVVAIEAGYWHALALKADGTVVSWGGNEAGQTEVPVDLHQVVQISGGLRHSVALMADGHVMAWGELDDGEPAYVPAELGPVRAISAKRDNTVVLKYDGSAFSWNTNKNATASLQSDLVQFEAHSGGGVALSRVNQVVRWGNSTTGLKDIPDNVIKVFSSWSDVGLLLSNHELQFNWIYRKVPLYGGSVTQAVDASLGQSSTLVLRDVSIPQIPQVQGIQGPASVAAGEALELVGRVNSTPAANYRWYRNGVQMADDDRVSGATTARLVIDPVSVADAGAFKLRSSTAAGAIFSSNHNVAVRPAPVFTQRPLSQLAWAGDTVEFHAAATGAEDMTYTWSRDGVVLKWAAGDTLRLDPVYLSDRGRYTVTARDANGETQSHFFLHTGLFGAEGVAWDGPDVTRYAERAKTHGGFAKIMEESTETKGLALGLDGRAFKWGDWSSEVASWDELVDLVDVLGFAHENLAIGLKSDGTLVGAGVGYNTRPFPAGLTEVVAIAGDGSRFSALRADGSVVNWQTYTGTPFVPRPNQDIVMLAGPNAFLRSDGTTAGSAAGNFPHVLVGTRSLVAGGKMALLRDGTVVRSERPNNENLPAGLNGVIRLADGIALRINGELVTWNPGGGVGGNNEIPAEASGAFEIASDSGSLGSINRYWALVPGTGPALVFDPQVSGLLEGGDAELRVLVGSDAPVNYQWYRNGVALVDSDRISGATGPVLRISGLNAGDISSYHVEVSTAESSLTSSSVGLSIIQYPRISQPPQSVELYFGASTELTVAVTGLVEAYQWRHDGVDIPGATDAALTLSDVTAADAGSYTVLVSNAAGSVESTSALVTVSPPPPTFTAHHQVTVDDRVPGGPVTIRNRFDSDAAIATVRWSVLLPDNWSLAEWTGSSASTAPADGATSLLEWEWNATPELPLEFTYVLNSPQELGLNFELAATVDYTGPDLSDQLLVRPDPLVLRPGYHAADTNHDFRFSLSELLRVIELYNTRAGTTRTGRYRLGEATEDGFAPDDRALGEGAAPTRFHSADVDHDARLSLSELLRVIELYNTRAGTTRTGGYRIESGTEDGFAPDASAGG